MRTLARRIAGLGVMGNNVLCACCGRAFRRFLPFGRPSRPNAMCPHCGSLERHRLLWLYLQRSGKLHARPISVLHTAPEPAIAERLRSFPNIRLVSTDLSDDDVSVRCDLETMPFRAGAFDGIICSHVLEHVSNDIAAMRELRRTLAPGGWALISVPLHETRATTDEDPSITDPNERFRRFGQRDHVRRYGMDFFDRLRRAGFMVEIHRVGEVIPADLVVANALNENEMFADCSAPAATG